MLVLTRGVNESIMIGDKIKVVLLRIQGDKVRIGISAPDNVDIHREEVFDAIQRNRDVHAPQRDQHGDDSGDE